MRILITHIVRVKEPNDYSHLAKVHLVEGYAPIGSGEVAPFAWILEHPIDGGLRKISEEKFREYEKNKI